MDKILEFISALFKMLSGILDITGDGALSWIFGKGADLIDENKDKADQAGE